MKKIKLMEHLRKRMNDLQELFFIGLRANQDNRCIVKIKGNPVNHGDGKGMKAPCILRFIAQKRFIDVLRNELGN